MKNYSIVSKNHNIIDEIKMKLNHYGFIENNEKPEFIISIGGDGTFLLSERMFPSIPKVIIKNESLCNLSTFNNIDEFISIIKNKNYQIKKHKKLIVNDNEDIFLYATSDITLRNSLPTHAIRFEISNNKKYSEKFIGDGILFSTKIGESGYYNSIVKEKFKKNCEFAIALNNVSINKRKIDFIDEKTLWQFKLNRGKCDLVVDNNPLHLSLEEGDIVRIKKSNFETKIILKKENKK